MPFCIKKEVEYSPVNVIPKDLVSIFFETTFLNFQTPVRVFSD